VTSDNTAGGGSGAHRSVHLVTPLVQSGLVGGLRLDGQHAIADGDVDVLRGDSGKLGLHDVPVALVPGPEHITRQPAYFVVGVDGGARSAAAFAFEEAALRGAAQPALYVWQPGLLGVLDEHAAQEGCRRLLSETVAGHGAAYPDVVVHHQLAIGHPVQVLTEESAHALGLEMGTPGHGGFAGMLVGSSPVSPAL
jgi:hypothetical protein